MNGCGSIHNATDLNNPSLISIMAETTTHGYRTVNEQTQHLETGSSMASLTRQQNGDPNINTLPPEVLSCIFVFGERSERFTRTQRFQHVKFPDLVSVSTFGLIVCYFGNS
jgi:hypothetical protein